MNEAFRLLKHTFLVLTGYDPSEVLAANIETRIFMTRNGGRYRVSEDLTSVERLSGPSWKVSERSN